MATLLDGVNKVLRRAQIIQSDLGTLTSSGKQGWIDICIQTWNEAMIDLYSRTDEDYPSQSATSTLTLVDGQRSYTLAADLITLNEPIKDETNGRYIGFYPGGYMNLVRTQFFINQQTGLPYLGAWNPVDAQFYLDFIPTSKEAGLVYRYWYNKNLEMTQDAAIFPFNNHVFLGLVPAVFQLWRGDVQNKFNEKRYNLAMGIASKALSQKKQHESYAPMRLSFSQRGDPYAQ